MNQVIRTYLKSTNAYFLYPFGCIVVGSGVLLRPFADESYSDTALLMGIGFVMAHELGHACLLPHDESAGNLMNASVVGAAFPVLSNLQVAIVRGSRHVTYL